MKNTFLIFLWIVLSGCGSGGDAEIYSPAENFYQSNKESEHFKVTVYGTIPAAATDSILNKLERNFLRVCTDILGRSAERKTEIKVWAAQSQFYDDMKKDLGVIYYGSGGYVYGPYEARILYSAPASASQAALHEFCHCVSMMLNRTIPNNPRWLWEAAAIYESGEFIHPRNISSIAAGNFPTLDNMNREFNQGGQIIYQVGYLVADYIISVFGFEKFRSLILSNGDISGILSLTAEQFNSDWKNFVKNKYSI